MHPQDAPSPQAPLVEFAAGSRTALAQRLATTPELPATAAVVRCTASDAPPQRWLVCNALVGGGALGGLSTSARVLARGLLPWVGAACMLPEPSAATVGQC